MTRPGSRFNVMRTSVVLSREIDPLVVRPIGIVHTPFAERIDAPRQGRLEDGARGTIELFSGHHFEDALADLESWEYLWVLYWFHLNQGWRPKVTPPRSSRRRGVFATRSPHRPNPVGMSVVKLLGVSDLELQVAGVDMLDGTPVIDLKPYVAYADALPGAGPGWLGAEPGRSGVPDDPRPAWPVHFEPLAEAQTRFLAERFGVELAGDITARLALGPQPHAYRRIRREGDGFRLALRDWRVYFRVSDTTIVVTAIATGYRERQLGAADPALDPHRALVAEFTSR